MKNTKNILFIIAAVSLLLFADSVRAECTIEWTGTTTGSISTNETSRTAQAAKELSEAMISITGSVSSTTPCYKLFIVCHVQCLGSCFDEVYIGNTVTASYCMQDGSWEIVPYFTQVPGAYSCEDLLGSGTWDVVCSTAITLASFEVKPGNNTVSLVWATESEIDNAGFNLYRAETKEGEYTKINDALIPAQGSPTQGASYEFTDDGLQNRKTYYYKLEDIDVNGIATFHGPVSATPRLIYGIGK